jgi:hypothetical protein
MIAGLPDVADDLTAETAGVETVDRADLLTVLAATEVVKVTHMCNATPSHVFFDIL